MKSIKKFVSGFNMLDFAMLALFLLISVTVMINHEPWRDESHAWLIARDSVSLGELYSAVRYEGTPILWHFMLFCLAKLGLPYFSMFVLHLLIIFTAVVVFLRYAPLQKLIKYFFIFGYYIIYEYNVIARNYGLTVLFLFLIAAVYKDRFDRPILYSLLILLLANSNVHSMLISMVITFIYFIELVFGKLHKVHEKKIISMKWLIPSGILLFGYVFAVIQLLPPSDLALNYSQWNFSMTSKHFFTIPASVVDAFTMKWDFDYFYFIIGIIFYLLSLVLLIRKLKPLAIYLLSTLGLLSIFFFKLVGGIRHHGFIFIMFIFCLWIAENYSEHGWSFKTKHGKKGLFVENKYLSFIFSKKFLTCLLLLLLLFHIKEGITKCYEDFIYDFSGSKRTAQFLNKNGIMRPGNLVAAYPAPMTEAILPFIPKENSKFYYLDFERFMSFVVWNTTYYNNRNLNLNQIIQRINQEISLNPYNNVFLILNMPVEVDIFKEYFDLIFYTMAKVTGESFFVYKLKLPAATG